VKRSWKPREHARHSHSPGFAPSGLSSSSPQYGQKKGTCRSPAALSSPAGLLASAGLLAPAGMLAPAGLLPLT